eukprot:1317544-Rhodomonas_salina.2
MDACLVQARQERKRVRSCFLSGGSWSVQIWQEPRYGTRGRHNSPSSLSHIFGPSYADQNSTKVQSTDFVVLRTDSFY